MSKRTLGKARGLNSIADPSDFKGRRGRPPAEDKPGSQDPTGVSGTGDASAGQADRSEAGGGGANGGSSRRAIPHRAAIPGTNRTRRELSVPVPISEALEATGINPADVVMSAYRKHGDAVYGGHGGRLVSRGRRRLRLSISDSEFDKLTRLGEARGWNRSETVAVLLALELLPPGDQS